MLNQTSSLMAASISSLQAPSCFGAVQSSGTMVIRQHLIFLVAEERCWCSGSVLTRLGNNESNQSQRLQYSIARSRTLLLPLPIQLALQVTMQPVKPLAIQALPLDKLLLLVTPVITSSCWMTLFSSAHLASLRLPSTPCLLSPMPLSKLLVSTR